MRLYSRSDLVLIGGLTAAGFVVFSGPISTGISMAGEIEKAWGLNLIPGLLILTAVLIVHTQSRRQEFRTQSQTAGAEAHQAQERAAELERLVSFGSSLSHSLDIAAVRNVVLRGLPQLAGRDDLWVVAHTNGHWETMVGATGADQDLIDSAREKVVEYRVSGAVTDLTDGKWFMLDGESCLPLMAGNAATGVIGVPRDSPPLSNSQRHVLAAAGAILAIALRNADLFREVRENALRDGLTGCFTRTHGLEMFASELRRARRSKLPIAAVMVDLDHFKQVNDRYGHQCGDAVLAAVGRRLRELLRSSDVKCRYGGEEFLIVLPETPLEGAERVAESLRREVSNLVVPWGSESLSITLSLGVAVAESEETDPSPIIARADVALYRAKETGRNCVRVDAGSSTRAA